MATTAPPLDEIVARRPDVLQWWMSGEHGLPPPYNPMEERMLHRYFSELPFFDWSTKNGLLIEQSRFNRPTFDLVHSGQAFEAELAKRPGVEYVIVGGGGPSGVWVIRKQDRKSEPRQGVGSDGQVVPFPRTETLGTYYVVGENVYQAPSVADVVGNRMLSATTSLSRFMERASRLPSFSPNTGHTYLPQTAKPTTTAGSTNGTPAHSREGSVAPGVDTQSLRSGSAPLETTSAATASAQQQQDARLLAQSLSMSIQFNDEYMDENPLQGEPGSFKFTSSTAAVKKRKADEAAAEKAAAAKAQEKREGSAGAVKAELTVEKAAATPPAVFTEARAGAAAKSERERKEERRRRRKSRPQNAPQTPGSAVASSSAG